MYNSTTIFSLKILETNQNKFFDLSKFQISSQRGAYSLGWVISSRFSKNSKTPILINNQAQLGQHTLSATYVNTSGRPGAPKVAIVLTSGEFDSVIDAAQAARAVQKSGIRMYGISFGGKKTMENMIKLFYKGNWQLLTSMKSFDIFNFITVFNQGEIIN